ncbi:hypothetical protein N8I71_04885 [Roseibacterium sp. SDUM158016]|uniref:hypothetical protein n=1 Tax=Roseicyclus sediminis TaxID=2980997 RepID=UPI0021D1FCC3|nr:hypothetical protein [Roseibacterium sp. SDUM158016]MCU4652152.1 hypothetical protein [Roseibacterium sp. SDUM158016]
MGPYTVIIGAKIVGASTESKTKIITPQGDEIEFDNDDLVSSQTVDTSELARFILKKDAAVSVNFSSEALRGFDFASHTILKYHDDGSTISKSRDDI